MGSKSKGKTRQVDFSSGIKLISEMADRKQLEYTNKFTTSLAAMKERLQALEDILIEKLGETNESINERILVNLEKMQGLIQVDTDVQQGSYLRVKVKEEVVGKEDPAIPMQDTFMCVGHNQIHAEIDKLVVGAKTGETRSVTLPDPDNAAVQRKLTVFVARVFKGEEAKNEAKQQENDSNPGQTSEDQKSLASGNQ